MQEQYFYGHGKLLISGEYFVLDGAEALALPTTVGQSMRVKYRQSYQPTLNWKSFDHTGNTWFESDFEFWHFNPIKKTDDPTQRMLSEVLRTVRTQNPHFLRDDVDVFVETKIEFPLEWGLGSSSTFIYNIAQWAYVSPFELLSKSLGGSGYDVACAQALGPILYKRVADKPQWETANFNPAFKDQLFLVYLGKKQHSDKEVQKYSEMKFDNKDQIISEISMLTREMVSTSDFNTFSKLMRSHEEIVSSALKYTKVKDLYFSDFWGETKSLGAWGGDFILVASNRSFSETREYFVGKGFETVIPFSEIVRT